MYLDTSKIRLRATHAEIPCPGCKAVITVRRADAYRDAEHTDVRRAVTTYATKTVHETVDATGSRPSRRWRRG